MKIRFFPPQKILPVYNNYRQINAGSRNNGSFYDNATKNTLSAELKCSYLIADGTCTKLLISTYVFMYVYLVAVLGAFLPARPAPATSAARWSVHKSGAHLHQRPLLSTQPARPRLQSREGPVRASHRLPAARTDDFGSHWYVRSLGRQRRQPNIVK